MTQDQGSTNPSPSARASPTFGATSRGLSGQIGDLIWLSRKVVATDSRSVRLWAAMTLAIGLLTPVQLWATKGVADNLQERLDGGPGAAMWPFAALWLAVLGFTLLAGQVEGVFAATARERGGAAIAAEALDHATRIDLASFEHQGFYDQVALVLTSAEEKASDVVTQFISFGWAIPRAAAYLAVLLVFDWRLALIATIPTLPAVWGWFFSGALYWHAFEEQTRERRLAAYYAGLLSDRQAAKEVRLFGLAPTLIARWEASYWTTARELRTRGLRIGLKQRGLSLLSLSFVVLGLAWYVSIGPAEASAGTVVVVISSFLAFYHSIYFLGQPIQILGQSSGFASNLRGFLNWPADGAGLPARIAPVSGAGELRLEAVSFTYPGGTEPTLSDISLTIPARETIALVGENGAGKSTLVKLMLGLYAPDSGRVLLDGVDLATVDPVEVRKRLSGVFQHFTRYPLSARDNVTLGDRGKDHQAERALEGAGLTRLTDRLPEGLDTILSPDLGGTDLSGGQWQRLAIARAGIREASLLALDEPTAALDPLAEVAIFKRFSDLARDRTTVLVSHRLGIARLADRIVVLERGRIVEQGTHDALIAQPDSEYTAMWDAQARWYR